MSTATTTDSANEEVRRRIALDPQPECRPASALGQLPLRPRKDVGSAPLSFAQERLWLLDQINPGNVFANLSRGVRMSGALNIEALKGALLSLGDRHQSLRTTFAQNQLRVTVDSQPLQLIAESAVVELNVIDLSHLPEGERALRAGEMARERAQRVFDLTLGPLWRLALLKLSDRDWVLLLNTHRIVCDEFSIDIFFEELWECYRSFLKGDHPRLEALPLQYADYAEWQRHSLQGDVLESQLAYWKGNLHGAPSVIELPSDRTRPGVQTWQGASTSIVLSKELTSELWVFSEREQSTLFVILLAAFQVLLARYSHQTDIVVGSSFENRDVEGTRRLLGPLANGLPLRADLSANPTFRELLKQLDSIVNEAQAHRSLPFEMLVKELQVERSLSHAPIFQVMLNLKRSDTRVVDLSDLQVEPFDFEAGISPLDLVLNVVEERSQTNCHLEYNSELFNEATASRMLGHFRQLLSGIVVDPERRTERLLLLTDAEREQILQQWNSTDKAWTEGSLLGLFENQAARTPDKPAIVFAGEQLSYRELNARANQLAHHIRGLGVSPDARVGICIDRGLEMVVAVLGTLKAGGAYVPLDPGYPSERLSFMLSDAQCQVLLTSERVAANLAEADLKKVCLDQVWEQIARESTENPRAPIEGENLAYLIYTSGSTGWPKGIAMPHRALTNLISWQLKNLPGPARTLQFASLSFDVSFQELFSTWCSGGTLLLATDELRREAAAMLRFLVEQRAERIFLPFVYLQHLAEAFADGGPVPTALREIVTAGEQLEITPQITQLFAHLKDCRLHNHYGPSESHVVTAHTLSGPTSEWATLPTIGRPIANTQIYIVDRNLEPVPVGVRGELCIGGSNVSRGYLNRPELTAERFVPNPFGDEPGARIYRTGDLARYLDNGDIEFLGRVDHQVKIRGFRIELGEIEATLRTHAAVRDVVVIPRKQNDALIAFVVVDRAQLNGHDIGLTSELRSHITTKLPDYMVPALFVEVDTLPLTPSGKVDRRALSVPDEYRPDVKQAHVAARDELEENLVRLWEKVLDLRAIGIRDNFFELGGHSLLAARLFAEIENRFGRNLPLATLFQAPTVEQLAAVLRATESPEPWSSLVTIQPHGSRPPLFCVHAGGANVLIYRPLSRHLGLDQPLYALQAQGLDGQVKPYLRVEDMAAHYIKGMRKVQPEGPYNLLGASFGGLVIFEMAHQLLAQGEKVALLAMLNTNCPVYSFLHRMRCHAGHLVQYGPKVHTHNLIGAVSRRLRKRAAPTNSIDLSNRELQQALESLPDADDPFVEVTLAIFQAEKDYIPSNKIYPGKITLFWANDAERDFEDNRLGWKRLAAGGLDVHVVPGDHTSIREEPNVSVLAEKLRLCL